MSTSWSTALQNISALLVTGYLADRNIIAGNMASVMILAILGVVAIPAFKGKPPGSLGVFALMGWPVIRMVMALAAAKGA